METLNPGQISKTNANKDLREKMESVKVDPSDVGKNAALRPGRIDNVTKNVSEIAMEGKNLIPTCSSSSATGNLVLL